jgi:transposase-like protein
MNNDQIVSSVAAGVAQAVASVMGGSGGSPIEVTVKVDSETLYRTVRKGERRASGRYGTTVAIG